MKEEAGGSLQLCNISHVPSLAFPVSIATHRDPEHDNYGQPACVGQVCDWKETGKVALPVELIISVGGVLMKTEERGYISPLH